ncbi:MAG: helix-turn-helix transcriptional regulator [Oscillospiraceae bacterium]|nr:helix-turn-helix transcriptional regulator [Oscillospiraceae bacterium]
MSFRTILGKLFLTDKDRQTIENDLRVVERYTEEVLEQERRIEEERKAAEAREAARKAEEARLAARRAEEAKLAAALREEEERLAAIQREQESLAAGLDEEEEEEGEAYSLPFSDARYSIASPEAEYKTGKGSAKKSEKVSVEGRFSPMAKRDEEKPKAKESTAKYSILSETGRYSLDIQEHEPADLFGYNSPYGIDDILTNPGIRGTMHRDMTFSEKMSQLMSKYGMSSADVYRAGNVDKTLFSKLLSNPDYKPSRDTAISIALALKLSPEEAEDLIGRAGFKLSHAMHRDIVIECCFKKRIFNVIEVNIILDRLGHKPLSRIPT